jgi:hypothetical protein
MIRIELFKAARRRLNRVLVLLVCVWSWRSPSCWREANRGGRIELASSSLMHRQVCAGVARGVPESEAVKSLAPT